MNQASPAVKIGTSRQVVIPKKIHDQLKLSAGDYLQVKVEAGRVIFTPKELVDKFAAAGVAAGLDDVRRGRVTGSFRSAKVMVRALHRKKFPQRKK